MNPIDLIWIIKQQQQGLTKAERRVAQVVLEDVDFAIHASIAELATRAEVSEPTITRFCRSLGSKGLKDFKLKLAQSLAIGGSYIREASPSNKDTSEMTKMVLGLAADSLNQLQSQLNLGTLESAVDAVAKARQVHFFGGGGGSTIAALEGQFRFFRLGVTAFAHTEGQLQCMTASILGPDDVVVAISLTGRSPEILKAVEVAKRYDVKVIAITKPNSPLAELSNYELSVSVPFPDDLYLPTTGRYALLGVIDLLAAGVAIRRGPDVLEGLRRIQYNLALVRGGEDDQPLGD